MEHLTTLDHVNGTSIRGMLVFEAEMLGFEAMGGLDRHLLVTGGA